MTYRDYEERVLTTLYLVGLLFLPIAAIGFFVDTRFDVFPEWFRGVFGLYVLLMIGGTAILAVGFGWWLICSTCYWLLRLTFGERVARWIWSDD